MKSRLALASLAALLVALPARADSPPGPAGRPPVYSFPDDEPAAPAPAARPGRGVEKGYSYDFADDPLTAQGLEAGGAILRVRPRGLRTTLIQPRLHFVPQLLRSVEDL